ncbi:MAG TPA: enoyl-CoA hydratase [Gammaproteobacteria bacterium]|nr:enoyl-CoA hydratase [Gammaproteobacteria bacterium]
MTTDEPGFECELFRHGDGDVAIFTVSGRTRINVIGRQAVTRCAEGIRNQGETPGIRCAVLQGATDEAFVGGADLKELRGLEKHNAAEFVGAIHELCAAIRDFPVPVIARIKGYCLGAGLEIAAACDFRICDSTAVFGMPEVKVGVPSVVEAALLPQLIGWGKTRELVFRGNLIGAEEADRIGLVQQQVGESDIDEAVAAAVGDILEAGPNAVRLQKSLCRQWEQLDIEAAIRAGLASFSRAYETDEPKRYCQRFFDRNKESEAP